MNIFLKQVCKYLVFLVCFYFLFLLIFGQIFSSKFIFNLSFNRGSEGFLYTRLNELDSISDIDILVLGSSHAYRGYDPRIFSDRGYKMFNLGSSSQTFLQTEFLLDRYLEQLNPKLVIIDVYPILLESDGVESTIDFVSNSNFLTDLWFLVKQQNNVKLYNTFFYSLLRKAIYKDHFSEPIEKNFDKYISGGYISSSSKDFKDEMLIEREILINVNQISSFYSVISKLKCTATEFVVIQAPITSQKQDSFSNISDLDSIYSEFEIYLNYNHLLSFDKSHFIDHSHLNQNGVLIFNTHILDTLEQLNVLPLADSYK